MRGARLDSGSRRMRVEGGTATQALRRTLTHALTLIVTLSNRVRVRVEVRVRSHPHPDCNPIEQGGGGGLGSGVILEGETQPSEA